ncbi:MAG: hypothetical protein LBQ20_05815 [Rhodanobacter sp.]|nr:hypothetical protein [Rhodanobacter sp.]
MTTAVVAGIAGVAGFAGLANAVDLNPDGLGQVLIYPYYTVNKNQDTLISIVNTGDMGKAVKVRFLEGYNSREVLDFNLYLSPHDVWAGAVSAISADPASGAQMHTDDHSCIDQLNTNPQPFFDYAYTGKVSGYAKDNGPQTIDRTREGHLEVIAMGDIDPASVLFKDITHVQVGTPGVAYPAGATKSGIENCTLPADAAIPGMLTVATSTLFGSASIADVPEGLFYTYNADALQGFNDREEIYRIPGGLDPSLADAETDYTTIGGGQGPGSARAYIFMGGSLVAADYKPTVGPTSVGSIDAVSAALTVSHIFNEYLLEPGVGSTSDWVVTFPTKRFYVDKVLYPGSRTTPFDEAFGAHPSQSQVPVSMTTFDREEYTKVTTCRVSPCLSQPGAYLPYEVNVITFAPDGATSASPVLGSNLGTNMPTAGFSGWADLNLVSASAAHVLNEGYSPTNTTTTPDIIVRGLPATGFWAMNVINANVTQGRMSNYSGAWRHRGSRCAGTALATSGATGGAACS